MKNYNFGLLMKMGMNNELKQKMLEAEGLKGVGVYLTLDHVLRHIKNYRIHLSIVPGIALNLHTSVRYIMKIVRNYGLFVIDGEEFYSPEITDMMLRVRIKILQNKEKKLQSQNKKSKGLSEIQELKKIKKDISITAKELYDSRKQSANMRTMINTISQFKLREREKEKRENAFGGRKENSLAARNFSQQDFSEGLTDDLNQDEDFNQDEVDNEDENNNQAEDFNQDEVSNQDEIGSKDEVNYQAEESNSTDELDLPVQPSQQVAPLAAGANSDPSSNSGLALDNHHSDNSGVAVDGHPSGNIDCTGTDVIPSSDQAKSAPVKIRRSSGRVDYSGGEVNVLQAAESLQGSGPLPIKNALQRCGEVKLWSDWADEMVNEDAYMERIAIYSRLGKWFMPHRKQIVELFKQHVEVYSTSDGLITQNDVRYYFANFLRPETPTWKWVIEKLQEEEEARKAADPYRFEKRVNGVRMYPGGGEIPDDATPRPSMYAVWSEISKSWVGK